MTVSVARVPTPSASRYLQQLAKHWSHRFEVTFSPEEATIQFEDGDRLLMRADSATLDLALHVADETKVARMRQVVEEHLNRFAFREGELSYDWRDSSAA